VLILAGWDDCNCTQESKMSANNKAGRLIETERVPAWVRTDDLSRHPESQIRAECDLRLVAEYAEAMLEGEQYPPVVIFQGADGWRYLADGHHRVDAAALAALKDQRRKAEALADVGAGIHERLSARGRRARRRSDARELGVGLPHGSGYPSIAVFDHAMRSAAWRAA
jgi:ParB-like nuclease domain